VVKRAQRALRPSRSGFKPRPRAPAVRRLLQVAGRAQAPTRLEVSAPGVEGLRVSRPAVMLWFPAADDHPRSGAAGRSLTLAHDTFMT
jgi:hypothetical protein